MVRAVPRMVRGRLCVLSKSSGGGKFYHLQYRKNTKLFQKYKPIAEVEAYESATEQYRRFMAAVDAFVDDMSRKCMTDISDETKKNGRMTKRAKRKENSP